MLVKEASQERYIFNDPAENMRRLIVVMEYVLQGNLEDFIYFLQDLIDVDEFLEFKETILKMIDELEVKEEEIQSLLAVKLPAS
ncbi:hypothetical protein [Mesobacillus sp. S13]|uniref:hypothetical protein n=1 Tax=Mesobacillus sp. S13 TaxID=2880221 RepID=UPI001CF59FCA|nr:hypothetical protein [Mesobacillus sp. S13]